MKQASHNRIRGLIFAGLLLASTAVQLIQVPLAHAAGVTKSTATIDQQVQANLYARSIATCFENGTGAGAISVIDVDNAHSGNWFVNASSDKQPVPDLVGQGYSECGGDDHGWITNAATFFGYSTPEAMLADLGWKKGANNQYSSPYGDVSGANVQQGKQAFNALKRKWGGDFEYGQAQDYWALQAVLQSACGLTATSNQSDASNSLSTGVTVNLPDSSNPAKTVTKYFTSDSLDKRVYIRPSYGEDIKNDKGRIYMSCREVRDGINKKAELYAGYLVQNPSRKPSADAVQSSSKIDTATKDGSTTCNPDIGGLGWIICPVMTFAADMFDSAWGFLADSFLSFDSTLVKDGNTTYQVWANFRNVANVVFVIAMLAVILSQVTSIGISNYGIKKMLPRIMVTAILVNVSYYLCSLAIDASNLLGYGISGLFNGMAPVVGSSSGTTSHFVGQIAAGTLMAGILVAGAAGIALALSGSVILAGLLALGLVVLILMLRKALIILLVIVAPLAFAAYLFPNTEQWFKKWWKLFYTLLLLFPIVGIVFASSKLASTVIYESAKGDVSTQLTALAVASLPFFAVPTLLKGALSGTGAIGAKLQGKASGAGGRMSKGAQGKLKQRFDSTDMARASKIREAGRERYRQERFAKRASGSGGGPSWYKKANEWRLGGGGGVTRAQQAGSEFLGRKALDDSAKAENDAVDYEARRLQMQEGWTTENTIAKAQGEFEEAMASKNVVKARAAQKILLSSGTPGLNSLQKAYTEMEQSPAYGETMNDAVGQKVLSDINGAGLKSKNAVLDKLSHSAPGTTVTDVANNPETFKNLTANELSGQSADNLQKGVASGGITETHAKAMFNNKNTWNNMGENKQKVLTEHFQLGQQSGQREGQPAPQAPQVTPQVPPDVQRPEPERFDVRHQNSDVDSTHDAGPTN